MTSGEELMLLLELNGYDINKYKLKKQLEFEKTGNNDLYQHKKFASLIVSHYNYVENKDIFRRNPLRYNETWSADPISLDDFIVTHHDLQGEVTLKEFLKMDSIGEVSRESILYDIFDKWVEDYRESSIIQMENLREMIKFLPKKNNKYRKPSRIAFLFTLFLTLSLILIYKNPAFLQPKLFPFIGDSANQMHNLLFDSNLFSLLGVLSILSLATYAVLSNLTTKLIKDARLSKSKRTLEIFDKWDRNVKDLRIDQSGYLEDYVDQVMQNKENSYMDLVKLGKPEILLSKFKDYVRLVEGRFDWTKKNYSKMSKLLRYIFIGATLFNILFYVMGFAMTKGLI